MATSRLAGRQGAIGNSKRGKNLRRKHRSRLERLEQRCFLTAQPFIGGDILVYRVGDGSISLTNGGNPIFLDEYSPSGTLVQSIEMPFSSNPSDVQGGVNSPPATPNPIVNAGSATPSGVLTLSQDGRFLTFTGYGANLPNNTGTNLKGSQFPRVVGRVDINGNVDTSTALIDYAGANASSSGLRSTPAGAISTDGSHFYVYSQQIDTVRYANLGDSTSVHLNTTSTAHFDSLQIYDGQLYGMGSDGKFYHVGAGLPTTGGQTLTQIPFSDNGGALLSSPTKPVDFFFVTVNPAAHPSDPTAPDTLYVTVPSQTYTVGGITYTGVIRKYTADSYDTTTPGVAVPTHWLASGDIQIFPVNAANSFGAVTGLTGYSTGTSVVMYATSGAYNANAGQYGGALFSYTDVLANDGANGSLPSDPTKITATTLIPFYTATNYNQGFRGLALVPNQAPVLTGGGNVNLPPLLENPASNTGSLVSAVLAGLGGSVTDNSASQRQGIAITAADQANGTWQFSLDGGSTWQNFPTVSNSAALTLAADANTKLRFVPSVNFSGNATLTFKAWDQSKGINGQTFDIANTNFPTDTSPFSTGTATVTQTISFVNQAPSFVRGPSQSILNTAGAQSIAGWATSINKGAPSETAQNLNFIVSVPPAEQALFAVLPSIDPATGTLTYTPAAGAEGSATVSVQLHDDGGVANGGHDTSLTQNFQIAITAPGHDQPPVNIVPFAPQTTLENQPLAFSSAGGNGISVSDPDDAGSSLNQVTITVNGGTATLNSTAGLNLVNGTNGTSSFTYQGTLANLNAALAGLTYTPAANISGAAAGQITIATNDGAKTSTDAITINITPVNQAPTFVSGGNVTVAATGSPYSAQWATGISAGPNESGQTVKFLVSTNNPFAFAVAPSISAIGLLTFTPLHGPGSTTTVTVTIQDDGGTANGGINFSTQTFLINQTAVDLAPAISRPGTQRLIKNTPLLISNTLSNPLVTVNEYNAVAFLDPDGFQSVEKVTLTATNGTIALASGSGVVITSSTGTSPNFSSVSFTGSIPQLNWALDGLIFTPTAGFTGTGAGGASIAISINDQSAAAGGPITTNTTLNIDVVNPPSLVISELLINPPGAPDHPNQYIEIRGTPNAVIPAGTYLISVSGSPISVVLGQTVTNYPTGTIVDTIDLSDRTLGSDGYLVILQNGNTYNNYPIYGGLGLIDPRATVLDNGINPDGSVAIGTGAGFGNDLVAPGSSAVGHKSLFRPNDVDLYKGSATFMLVNSPGAVNPGDSLDSPLNQTPTGTLHGAEYSSWNVLDAVGASISTQSLAGDVAYGFINYVDNTLAGSTNFATPNSTTIVGGFTADYFGRGNDNFGWVASDWIGSGGLNGIVPTYLLGGKPNTVPSSASNRPLNNIGGPNFDALTQQAAVVTTAKSTINYPVGSGPIVIDPTVTVTDADSFFLGSAQVAITTNLDPLHDKLDFAGTPFITANYNATTGVLTLSGADTIANWNAALESVTYEYTNSVVANPISRKIVFSANDGLKLSDTTNSFDNINIQGTVVNPPIVTGTSATPLTWTEVLPPTSATPVVIAPDLTIADVSTSQLTSATVAISANFASGQDTLGWDTALAATNHITVTPSAQNRTLTLTPTSPDTAESLAAFQAVLRTVTYSNTSQNPSVAARTVTITVVDDNGVTSGVNAPNAAQQVVNLTAVNNPPAIATSVGSANYTAATAGVLIDPTMTVADPDSINLSGATVSIMSGFSAGDTLSFVNQAGITGSYNVGTGVLTLAGTALPIDYQVAMRAITFSNTNAAASSATRTISFQASDGQAGNIATKQIGVQQNLKRGDWGLNGQVTEDDIPAMLSALTNLNGFQTSRFSSVQDFKTVCDVNQDGAVNNRDIQAMLDLIISQNGGGAGSGTGSGSAVVTSTVQSLAPATTATIAPATTVSFTASHSSVMSVAALNAPVIKQSTANLGLKSVAAQILPAAGPMPKTLAAGPVDQALTNSPMYRSRHIRWGTSVSSSAADEFFAAVG